MLFVASLLEPYLTPEGGVAWRPPMPVVMEAEDLDGAETALRERFWVKEPEIERKLREANPEGKAWYYEAKIALLPDGFRGAESLFIIVADSKARTVNF
jgi:hypothetical protein